MNLAGWIKGLDLPSPMQWGHVSHVLPQFVPRTVLRL